MMLTMSTKHELFHRLPLTQETCVGKSDGKSQITFDSKQSQCAVSLPVSLIAHSHVTKILMGVDCVDVLTILTQNLLKLWKSLAQRFQSGNGGPFLLLLEGSCTIAKLLLATSSPTATIVALD